MNRIPLSRTDRRADDGDSLVEPAAANRHRSGRIGLRVAALAGFALLLAACSGGNHDAASGGRSTTPAEALAQADNYTACMRTHGVSEFPEPTVVNGQITFAGPSGLGRTPAFPSAQQTCGQSIYGTSPVQGSGGG